MRTPVSEMMAFYGSPLGKLVSKIVADKLEKAWGDGARCRIAGFGYVPPVLTGFSAAERVVALVPEGMGVEVGGAVPAALVHDHYWPIPDASIDRLVIYHGVEEVAGPRRLLREAWRVLADDGYLIVVAVNRRGLWALAETSPFAHGRPYSRRQLDEFLRSSLFEPTAQATALHFPPSHRSGLLHIAPTWERLGGIVEGWHLPAIFPNVAGLNLIEARKSTALPIGGSKAEVFRSPVLVPPGLSPSNPRQGRDKTKSAASASKLGSLDD